MTVIAARKSSENASASGICRCVLQNRTLFPSAYGLELLKEEGWIKLGIPVSHGCPTGLPSSVPRGVCPAVLCGPSFRPLPGTGDFQVWDGWAEPSSKPLSTTPESGTGKAVK